MPGEEGASQGDNDFGRKILNSGYSLKQAEKIILGGIRGWERIES